MGVGGALRVVHEHVELATRNLAHGGLAGHDVLLLGHIEGDRRHAGLGKVGNAIWSASGCNDMESCKWVQRFIVSNVRIVAIPVNAYLEFETL